MNSKKFILVVLGLIATGHLFAATIYVSPVAGDDTQAIQNAINSAVSGDTVHFNSGIYNISNYIEVNGKDNLTLDFDYDNTKIIQATTGLPVLYVYDCQNLQILDIWVEYNGPRVDFPDPPAADLSYLGEVAMHVKNFSSGIFASGQKGRITGINGLYISKMYAYGFVQGAWIGGRSDRFATGIELGEFTTEMTDYGLVMGSTDGMVIDKLTGINEQRSQPNDPEHAIYVCGSTAHMVTNLTINELNASGIANGSHAFQFKYVDGLTLPKVHVDGNTAAIFNLQCVKNATVGNASAGTGVTGTLTAFPGSIAGAVIVCQLDDNNILFQNVNLTGTFDTRFLAVTTGAKNVEMQAPHVTHQGPALNYNFIYNTGGGSLKVTDPNFSFAVAPNSQKYIFYASGSGSYLDIRYPIVTGLAAQTGFFKVSSETPSSFLHFKPDNITNSVLNPDSIYINGDAGNYGIVHIQYPANLLTLQASSTPICNYTSRYWGSNTSPITITSFRRMYAGGWNIYFTNGNTTLRHTANVLELSGGVNWTPVDGDAVTIQNFSGVCRETNRWRWK
jgi:hypothetical protein